MLRNSLLANKRIKKYSKTDEDMVDLLSKTFIFSTDFEYRLVEVTDMSVARPDILSKINYGSDQYGDLICKINGISNPLELQKGQILVLPDPPYLKTFLTREDTDIDGLSKDSALRPTPKHKKEKRKTNDAIDGDVRYKIDSSNRIIIY